MPLRPTFGSSGSMRRHQSGVADLDDPALKDRIVGLEATRDQAQADAERAQAILESSGQQAATAAIISVRSHNGSRLRTRKSASWDRMAICSERSPLERA